MNPVPASIRTLEQNTNHNKIGIIGLSTAAVSIALVAIVILVATPILLTAPGAALAIISVALFLTVSLVFEAHLQDCEMKTNQKHLTEAYKANLQRGTIIECWTTEVDKSQEAAATLTKNKMIDPLLALSDKAFDALMTISAREMKTFIELTPEKQKKVLEIIDGTDLESNTIEFLIDMISLNNIKAGHLTQLELESMTNYRILIKKHPSNIVRECLKSEETHQWVEKWKARHQPIEATRAVYPNLRLWIETPRPTQQLIE